MGQKVLILLPLSRKVRGKLTLGQLNGDGRQGHSKEEAKEPLSIVHESIRSDETETIHVHFGTKGLSFYHFLSRGAKNHPNFLFTTKMVQPKKIKVMNSRSE